MPMTIMANSLAFEMLYGIMVFNENAMLYIFTALAQRVAPDT